LVSLLVSELRANPVRFRATDGYDRLTRALEAGNNPQALKEYLGEATEFAGDVLWSIAEMEDVTDYVGEALQHLASADKGTAAYAMEIVLRAGHAPELRAVFEQWRVCDEAVCAKAACDLSWQGADRLGELLAAAGEEWCSALALKLSSSSLTRSEIEGLILQPARERQVVGVVLASIARERDASYLELMALSPEAWIREYGDWLSRCGPRSRTLG
jgi:hypothetical protein